MFQMTGKVDEHALAVYGFLPEIKRIEPAGISYECRIVLDKIALNRCTLPVCKVVLESASPDEQEVSFIAFFLLIENFRKWVIDHIYLMLMMKNMISI